jgi:hypothetical protein
MWDDKSQTEIQSEYERIGYQEGKRWPFPDNIDDPAAFLKLLRRVPDGAGLSGHLKALSEAAEKNRVAA